MEKHNISETSDDAILWSLSIKGDQKALEILYMRYYALLLNYGLKFDSDRDLVKDCIQDLFMNLFANSRISTSHVTVRSYLLRSLRNIIVYKLESRKQVDSLDDVVFNIPVNEDLIELLFPKNDEEMQLENQLLEAISQLSSQQKTILYLRYVKGLSYKEVSEVMEINVQSSMNLTTRALTKLRSLMKDDKYLLLIQFTLIKLMSTVDL